MGSCASVEKATNSVKKLQLSFTCKNDKLVNPSPVQDGSPISRDLSISGRDFKSQWTPTQPVTAFRDLGSKDDTFFESQPWLESDCEDDFFSVKGDFTPSRGNTPVHHSFSKGGGTPRLDNLSSPFNGNMKLGNDGSSQPSPMDGKKKMLLELFRESIGGDQEFLDILMAKTEEVKSSSSPLSKGDMTPIRPERRIPLMSAQCCFPMMNSPGTKKTSPMMSGQPCFPVMNSGGT